MVTTIYNYQNSNCSKKPILTNKKAELFLGRNPAIITMSPVIDDQKVFSIQQKQTTLTRYLSFHLQENSSNTQYPYCAHFIQFEEISTFCHGDIMAVHIFVGCILYFELDFNLGMVKKTI